MNICIEKFQSWLCAHPRTKEWLWFFALWFAGLLTVMAMTYPIKLLIKIMS